MPGVVNAYLKSGSTFGARVQAAVNDVEAIGGGIVDARDFFNTDTSVSNTITSTIAIASTAPVTVLLGNVTISCSAAIAFEIGTAGSGVQNVMTRIEGSSDNSTILNTTATGRGVVASNPIDRANTVFIQNIRFDKSVTATGSAAIDMAGDGTLYVHDVIIVNHFDGIAIRGHRSNIDVCNVRIYRMKGSGIIQESTGTDFYYSRVLANRTGSSADRSTWSGTGFLWKNGNTVYMTDCAFLTWGTGVLISPAQDQVAQFGFFKAVVADQCGNVGIDLTQSGNAICDLITLTDCWCSGCVHVGLRINLPAGSGPVRDGIQVIGGKYHGNGVYDESASWLKFGIEIDAGRVFVGAGALCRDNESAGIAIGPNAQEFSIVGIHTGVVTLSQNYGIAFIGVGSANHYIITSNNLRGNTVSAFNAAPPGANKIVADNLT